MNLVYVALCCVAKTSTPKQVSGNMARDYKGIKWQVVFQEPIHRRTHTHSRLPLLVISRVFGSVSSQCWARDTCVLMVKGRREKPFQRLRMKSKEIPMVRLCQCCAYTYLLTQIYNSLRGYVFIKYRKIKPWYQ